MYSDNAEVSVSIHENDNELSVIMENSGPVISDEDRNKLFEAFIRGKNFTEYQWFWSGTKNCTTNFRISPGKYLLFCGFK